MLIPCIQNKSSLSQCKVGKTEGKDTSGRSTQSMVLIYEIKSVLYNALCLLDSFITFFDTS